MTREDRTEQKERPRAVVLLSGGLDSSTVVAVAQRDGYEVYAISFRYGQRHAIELQAAERIAERASVSQHKVVDIDLRAFGGSALTADIAVPKDRDLKVEADIPVTYVPARNTIFLAFALAYAEVVGASDIWIGVNALDYSGYPDCREEYISAFESVANLATRAGVDGTSRFRIRAPLQHLTKAEIIKLGLSLGVDYSLTTSCYDPTPSGESCGGCDSCQLRLQGFETNGVADPIRYAASQLRVKA